MERIYLNRKAQMLCGSAEEIRSHREGPTSDRCIRAKNIVMVGDPADEIIK